MQFKHYLITRFNLRNPNWDVTKNQEEVLTDQWMEHRMQLFENYCLPSVQAQSNQNFIWLIYFDITTPETFKNKIEALLKPFPNFKPRFIAGMTAFYPSIKADVIASSAEVPYLITSRIDNDDCIHRDYINTIQQQFNAQNFMAFDALEGYTIQINKQVLVGKKEHIFNPFMSLIEKNQDPKTVWIHTKHPQWKKEKNVKQLRGKRLWLSIIHDKNKINEFDGYGNVDWDRIKKDFVLSDSVQEYISKHITPYAQWRLLGFKNQIKIKYTLFSKNLKRGLGLYKLK